MWKELKQFLINLYLKIHCAFCCKSKCEVEIGKNDCKKVNEGE